MNIKNNILLSQNPVKLIPNIIVELMYNYKNNYNQNHKKTAYFYLHSILYI